MRALGRLTASSALAGVLVAAILLPAVGGAGLMARDGAAGFHELPAGLATPPLPQRSTILAADGSRLATFYFENRIEVRLNDVAPILRKAVLAIEDSRFYDHGALDAQGTLRALFRNLQAGAVREGGSTLTQQYVKNVLVESARNDAERARAQEATPARKLRELRYALEVERRFSKDQIFERYLNIAYFGDGAFGVEAASRHYFDKAAAKLALHEAALLAGVVRNPYANNPRLHAATATARRATVLDRMVQLGEISRAEGDAARRKPLGLKLKPTPNGCVTSRAPFFCDYVQREILTNPIFGTTAVERQQLLKRGGLTIKTTLVPRMQRAAQGAVDRWVPRKNSARKAAAEVLVEPGSGHIKGMVVDRRLGDDRKRGSTWVNFAADADHGASIGMQAGSTFKAFTLARALEEGMPFGWRTNAPKAFVPTGYRDCAGKAVGSTKPLRNSAESEGGRKFSLLTGTHHSVNTFFLGLERKVGLCDTVRMAERLGMRRGDGGPLKQLASFTLGADTVSPVRVAAAYAAFGARGKYCKPIAITSMTDAQGRRHRVPDADCKQVFAPGVADAVNHVLRGVLTKGTARGMAIGRPAAGKTGTVDDFSAAWFAGYTPNLAAAVWVGDPRGGYQHPLRNVCLAGRCYSSVYGASLPAPIWRQTMIGALRGVPPAAFTPPPGRYFSRGSGEDAEKKRLPDVRGMRPAEALAKLAAEGFRPRLAERLVRSRKYPAGTVAMTRPGPGSRVEPRAVVEIIISRGPRNRGPGRIGPGDPGGPGLPLPDPPPSDPISGRPVPD
jgi:membrane peptidoglycan carboxypeptidase